MMAPIQPLNPTPARTSTSLLRFGQFPAEPPQGGTVPVAQLLATMPAADKQQLNRFFETGFRRELFGYVLFGYKPMAFVAASNFEPTAWATWQRYQPRLSGHPNI